MTYISRRGAADDGGHSSRRYDHFDNAQLLLTYGFVASEGEGALPATARLPFSVLENACAAVRDASAAGREAGAPSGRGLPWDVAEGWAERAAACTRLLAPHCGVMSVSAAETSE